MKLPLRGECLCGAIRYEISREPLSVYVCHCPDCQGGTGSAFSIGIFVPDEAFRETGGETRSVFGGVTLSGRVKSRRVCPDCGTWVYGDPRTRAQYSGMVVAKADGTPLHQKRAALDHSSGRREEIRDTAAQCREIADRFQRGTCPPLKQRS
jgi:hypothetical protein